MIDDVDDDIVTTESGAHQPKERGESKLVYTLQTANNSQSVKVILSTLPMPGPQQIQGGGSSVDPMQPTPQSEYKQEMNNPTVGPSSSTTLNSEQNHEEISSTTTTTKSPLQSSYHREETYPPLVHYGKTTYSPIISPHCLPVVIRSLSWPPTHPGSVAQVPCPAGTRGLAHWACANSAVNQPSWLTQQPDLSECQSYWIDKIILELRKSDSIVTIAQDMVDYVRVNTLYGGDIIAIIKAMTIITEKLDFQVILIFLLDSKSLITQILIKDLTELHSCFSLFVIVN